MAQHSAQRIEVLDSFRAIAIFAVMAFHLAYLGERNHGTVALDLPPGVALPVSYGWLGVEFFLIISGFVIFMTLERCVSISVFAWRRLIRLWPAYIASVAIIYSCVHALGYWPFERSNHDLMASMLLWAPALKAEYISGVYWSLVVEVRLYAIVAVVYFGAGRDRFVIAWLLVTVMATALFFLYRPLAIHLLSAEYLPFFTMGIYFYRNWRGTSDRIDQACLVVALASLVLMWSEPAAINGRNDQVSLLIMVAMPIVFWLFVRGYLGFLAVAPLLFIGRISYSLYLVHHELTLAIAYNLTQQGWSLLVALLIATAMAIGLAAALTLYLEEPAKRGLKALVAMQNT